MPITEFPIETIAASDVPGLGGQGSVFFSQTDANGEGMNIYCGPFYKAGETLSDCRWEFWYRPELAESGAYSGGYVNVAGNGGNHEVLHGLSVQEEWSSITGNFHVTSAGPVLHPNSYTSLDEFATGEFVHSSVGIKGSDIYVHVFGVLSNVVPLETARVAIGSDYYVSGSDHNNAAGYHFGSRGYEGSGVMADFRQNFTPDHYFVPNKLNFAGDAYSRAVFCMMTDYPSGAYLDTSDGHETVTGLGAIQHHGRLNIGVGGVLPRSSGVFPVFVPGVVPEAPVAFRAVPSTPGGALVFDSFNRAPVVPAWHAAGIANNLKLGTAPSGSLGPLVWQGSGGWGILDGRGYSSYQTLNHPYVITDRSNIRLSVKRMPNTLCKTGLTARYVDDSNCIYVKADPTLITIFNVTGGVSTNTSWVTTSGYEKIELNVNGTTATVYKDGVSLGTFTVTANGSLNHGLYANTQLDDIYRFDDFTAVAAT